ncbi:MAG: S9 family peptidase, partial [Gammaproteobacteria bacterium]|nr:S9 family peptidase [Gammaproteobacteria bacterium]NIW39931.1 S9 family peptidase [candidate division Zixibacteria bacterium]NIX57614.1 S9 family peptidase [candidate division Zixibacteria bacterium]
MMRYPKAGDPNPVVKIGVVSVSEDPETVWMDVGEETDIYLPRMYWFPNGEQLAIMRLDRAQHHLDFLVADITSGKSEIIVEEEDPYWINIEDHVYFFENSEQF